MSLGECGRFPIAINDHIQLIKYWLRLLQIENIRYPKQCNKMLKSQHDIGRINWVSKVRDFLFIDGFGLAWISQEIGNPAQFILKLINILNVMVMQFLIG